MVAKTIYIPLWQASLHYNGKRATAPGLPRPSSPEVQKKSTTGRRLFVVLLDDDDDHTYDYVIRMLQKLFMASRGPAYRHAKSAKLSYKGVP